MKKILIFNSILVVSLIMFLPHKKIETNNKNFNVYIKEGDSYVKQESGAFPTNGYVLNTEESSCTGGGTLSQNETTKKINLQISSQEKCDLYFDAEPATATIRNLVGNADSTSTDVITVAAPQGATCTNTLAYDGTTDNNLRYVGANPCNYVTFNGETAGWRIIGAMNNVDDGTGNTEIRLKLVRASSLGSYSWDTSTSNVNSGYGVNEWIQADIMTELNGDYLDTTLTANTNWYNNQNNDKTGIYDYTKGLKANAQILVGDAKWYLGGTALASTSSTFYTAERGTTVWGNPTGTCNDGFCPRATEWTGKVALIYPSDYGFAAGGTVRSTCLGKNLDYFDQDNCPANDWLFIDNTYQWLLSPNPDNATYSFPICGLGFMVNYTASSAAAVRPAVYLKSNVAITGGDGSENNPYTLG